MEELTSRQADIVSRAREQGRVRVDELAEVFEVSPQTIRKDLNDLCERRILQRIHGGAVVGSGVENLGYEARRVLAEAEKRRIGRLAAGLIPDGSSLFVNIGTTTEAVARALVGHRGLMVITNNLNVANTLYSVPEIEVIVAGGLVRPSDAGVVGEATVEFIRQFKVDFAVIGASAIDLDGALLDFDYREVRAAQAIIENARHVILVADRLKLTRRAPVRIAHLGQIDTFVTDETPPERLVELCHAQEVELHVANEETRAVA